MRCFKWSYAFVMLLIAVEYFATQVRQEGAVFNYCNPTYITDCYAITKRLRRGGPYRTNFTGITLHPWDNNVTTRVVLHPDGVPLEIVNTKLCDMMNIEWLLDYIRTFSDDKTLGPAKAGLHMLKNIELPPKNLPQTIRNLFKGKIKIYVVLTKTEELIVEATVTLRDIK